MPKPSGPHGDDTPAQPAAEAPTEQLSTEDAEQTREGTESTEILESAEPAEDTEDADTALEAIDALDAPTEVIPEIPGDPPTEVLPTESATTVLEVETDDAEAAEPAERQFTAPGYDAGDTEVMTAMNGADSNTALSDGVAGEEGSKTRPLLTRLGSIGSTRNRGWLVAIGLAIALLLVVAVLGVLWMTGGVGSRVSAEERVRETIENFNVAVQDGDLPTLRAITCGDIRDGYVNYDQTTWDDIYSRVAAARQYPVIASIDEVVVNKEHAEANVTAYMAFAPQIRSTRSFDLQYHDHQWKICQSRIG